MHLVYSFIGGVFTGGALSYLYASKVIKDVKAAAAKASVYASQASNAVNKSL